ncbi:MAG: DUF2497 domain-containing protein [Rhizomicrobium sp.]|nr:DUF2497 domain-containing protein [Rhizomicrobium sp.]
MVSSPQHEPTMEEILASIRKIISEDSTEQAPAAAPAAEPVHVAEPEADILDLTQEVAPEPVRAAAPVYAPAPVYEAPPPVHEPENDVVFENIEPEEHHTEESVHHDIFTDKTRQSIDDAFAAIDEPDEEEPVRSAPARGPATDVSGLSVEAVFERAVREAFEPVVKQWLGANAPQIVDRMKPLIREWMDEHFPALLEGAVRDEVARVAKARGTKK